MGDRLKGRAALVTGSAQGIGAAILKAFRDEGAAVTGLDRVAHLGAVVYDLAETDGIAELVDSLHECPQVLVNAAGVCLTRTFFEIDLQSFERTFAINVVAAFALSQAVAKRLVREGKTGVILNIASNSGFVPKLEQLDYGASKAALISITRSSALALGPSGIRVNAVAPGVIDTPLTQAIAAQRARIREVSPEETLQPVLKSLPLGRMGTPEEVASLAVFLASDEAAFITGQTYVVDGGQIMR